MISIKSLNIRLNGLFSCQARERITRTDGKFVKIWQREKWAQAGPGCIAPYERDKLLVADAASHGASCWKHRERAVGTGGQYLPKL